MSNFMDRRNAADLSKACDLLLLVIDTSASADVTQIHKEIRDYLKDIGYLD